MTANARRGLSPRDCSLQVSTHLLKAERAINTKVGVEAIEMLQRSLDDQLTDARGVLQAQMTVVRERCARDAAPPRHLLPSQPFRDTLPPSHANHLRRPPSPIPLQAQRAARLRSSERIQGEFERGHSVLEGAAQRVEVERLEGRLLELERAVEGVEAAVERKAEASGVDASVVKLSEGLEGVAREVRSKAEALYVNDRHDALSAETSRQLQQLREREEGTGVAVSTLEEQMVAVSLLASQKPERSELEDFRRQHEGVREQACPPPPPPPRLPPRPPAAPPPPPHSSLFVPTPHSRPLQVSILKSELRGTLHALEAWIGEQNAKKGRRPHKAVELRPPASATTGGDVEGAPESAPHAISRGEIATPRVEIASSASNAATPACASDGAGEANARLLRRVDELERALADTQHALHALRSNPSLALEGTMVAAFMSKRSSPPIRAVTAASSGGRLDTAGSIALGGAPRPPSTPGAGLHRRLPGGTLAPTEASQAMSAGRGMPREEEEGAVQGPPFRTHSERRSWLLQEKRRWLVEMRLGKNVGAMAEALSSPRDSRLPPLDQELQHELQLGQHTKPMLSSGMNLDTLATPRLAAHRRDL